MIGEPKVCWTHNQGRNEGGAKGTQFLGRRITAGGASNNITSTYFHQYSTISSEKPKVRTLGAPNLLLAPGAILTSLRRCT